MLVLCAGEGTAQGQDDSARRDTVAYEDRQAGERDVLADGACSDEAHASPADEIATLRGEIARLEAQVGELQTRSDEVQFRAWQQRGCFAVDTLCVLAVCSPSLSILQRAHAMKREPCLQHLDSQKTCCKPIRTDTVCSKGLVPPNAPQREAWFAPFPDSAAAGSDGRPGGARGAAAGCTADGGGRAAARARRGGQPPRRAAV